VILLCSNFIGRFYLSFAYYPAKSSMRIKVGYLVTMSKMLKNKLTFSITLSLRQLAPDYT
jgi:hypothetical protein